MYLWFAIDVDKYFNDLKIKVEAAKNKIGFRYGTNGLPYHISLKISFEAPKGLENDIISTVEDFYKTLKSFTVRVKEIEANNKILWVRYYDNDYLKYIGTTLNKLLNDKYGIKYHDFDINFIFHTTLFMNENQEIINKGYELLKDEELPNELIINKLLIGYSPMGIPETYSVLKEIELS